VLTKDKVTHCLKKGTPMNNTIQLHQFTIFTNYVIKKCNFCNSQLTTLKSFLIRLKTSCTVSITTIATRHTATVETVAKTADSYDILT